MWERQSMIIIINEFKFCSLKLDKQLYNKFNRKIDSF